MVRAIVLLCFFSGIVSVFADEPVTQDVGSLVEAFRAQTSSWEKGDVLIRVEKFHDSTGGNGEGDYRETLGYYRFRFDHLNQNYWYYGASESRSGDGSLNPVRKEQLHVDRSAFAIIKGSARIRSFPNRSVRAEFKDFQEWADQYNFRKVGLRNIGFTPFGESRISQGNNSATAMASGYVETTVDQLADGNSKAFFKFPVQRAYQ